MYVLTLEVFPKVSKRTQTCTDLTHWGKLLSITKGCYRLSKRRGGRKRESERATLTGFLVGGRRSCWVHLRWVRCWRGGRGSISCLHRYRLVRRVLHPLVGLRLSERCSRLGGVMGRAGHHGGVGGGGDHSWKTREAGVRRADTFSSAVWTVDLWHFRWLKSCMTLDSRDCTSHKQLLLSVKELFFLF